MYSYIATIGRNVGDMPMSDARWSDFILSVKTDMLTALDADKLSVIEVSEGVGEWEGVTEPNATITVRRHTQAQDSQVERLRRYLSENARHFDQDAIALTIGISELC